MMKLLQLFDESVHDWCRSPVEISDSAIVDPGDGDKNAQLCLSNCGFYIGFTYLCKQAASDFFQIGDSDAPPQPLSTFADASAIVG